MISNRWLTIHLSPSDLVGYADRSNLVQNPTLNLIVGRRNIFCRESSSLKYLPFLREASVHVTKMRFQPIVTQESQERLVLRKSTLKGKWR